MESALPTAKVSLSCPVLRLDNAKSRLTIHHLKIKMKSLNMDVISNDNVEVDCLGNVGFYLNLKGAGRLAINDINVMR